MSPESPIEERCVRNFEGLNLTLCTAESCTGGLIAHLITCIPGAANIFTGGIVAYHNSVKVRHLGVKTETLAEFGAVSEQTAREMAEGAQYAFETDYALSITGIAGPSGGTESKPVGLVYIGLCGPDGTRVEQHNFTGDRPEIQQQAARRALSVACEAISK